MLRELCSVRLLVLFQLAPAHHPPNSCFMLSLICFGSPDGVCSSCLTPCWCHKKLDSVLSCSHWPFPFLHSEHLLLHRQCLSDCPNQVTPGSGYSTSLWPVATMTLYWQQRKRTIDCVWLQPQLPTLLNGFSLDSEKYMRNEEASSSYWWWGGKINMYWVPAENWTFYLPSGQKIPPGVKKRKTKHMQQQNPEMIKKKNTWRTKYGSLSSLLRSIGHKKVKYESSQGTHKE